MKDLGGFLFFMTWVFGLIYIGTTFGILGVITFFAITGVIAWIWGHLKGE
jgi:hypothetical protein